jgi:hypothetical protein
LVPGIEMLNGFGPPAVLERSLAERRAEVRCCFHSLQQRAYVDEASAASRDGDDRNPERRDVLPMLQALVARDEYGKFFLGNSEQLAVGQPRPALLLHCSDFEFRQIMPKFARHVLVEENAPHDTRARSARPASSTNATA